MRIFILANLMIGLLYLTSCRQAATTTDWTDTALDVATFQLKQTAREFSDSNLLPRSTWTFHEDKFLTEQLNHDAVVSEDPLEVYSQKALSGQLRTCDIYDWTSGFFPGSLWYAYEITGDEELKEHAVQYTNMLYPVRNLQGTHDLGFMINSSYGNALRLMPNDTIINIIIETAQTLGKRFDEHIGCIRSWDFGPWNYPVIIDNMMNLELLFKASRLSGNKEYYDMAVRHARTTMGEHFRPDYTSYHLVSYNADGSVETRQTHQGKNHDSAWARGQGWAVYGYTMCYRETKDSDFLKQATNVADMIMTHVTTNDSIPYWDYNAPASDTTPRDASAACVTASALLELSRFAPDGQKYFDYAEAILKNLSGNEYLAEKGANHGFILKHSTGSLPHNSEVDTPINYADYYFLEALKRYRDILNIQADAPSHG